MFHIQVMKWEKMNSIDKVCKENFQANEAEKYASQRESIKK